MRPGGCGQRPPALCAQGGPVTRGPRSHPAPAWRYLPSVTLRQHLLFFLLPLDLGSGQGCSAGSARKSCSPQYGRPSWVELKAAPSWCSLQNELGQKWQNEVEGFPHTSQ